MMNIQFHWAPAKARADTNGLLPGLDPNLKWLTEDEMRDLLKMHGNTLYNHRVAGHIGYSQPGAKIYYSQVDYQLFMKRFYRGPKE